MLTEPQKKMLSDKLDASHVKPPQQYGPKGDYLEGWHVIAEANRIFGFDGWSYEAVDIRCVSEAPRKVGKAQKDGWGITYVVKVRVDVGGVIREDLGAGHGYDVDAGLAHESAIKEAVTDALKRALRTFGNPFGLALYDKTRANVDSGDKVEASKPTSAAEQKRGLEAIEADLLDCRTIAAVDACAKGWASIMKRDGWSPDFVNAAKPKFEARRKLLRDTIENEQFPGDRPSNGTKFVDSFLGNTQ